MRCAFARGSHRDDAGHRRAHDARTLLHHHAHLLRERRAAHRHGLHHHRRRCGGARHAHGGARRTLPHWPRRTRPESGRGGRRARHDSAGVVRFAGAAVCRAVEDARHIQRRLHPHDPSPPRARRPAVHAASEGCGLPVQGGLRGLVLHPRGDLLHRLRGHRDRRPEVLPRLSPAAALREKRRGELVFQALGVRRQAARALRCAARFCEPAHTRKRGARLCGKRPARSVRQPFQLRLGRAAAFRS